jgi:hypothetical protein
MKSIGLIEAESFVEPSQLILGVAVTYCIKLITGNCLKSTIIKEGSINYKFRKTQMQTLNDYTQANQDDIMDILENEVNNLSIPLQLKTKFISILNDNVAEIMEYNYDSMVSAQIDRAYDEHKDSR